MNLIYINKVGKNHKGEFLYEFIFSDRIDIIEIDGDNWDVNPANGKPEPPDLDYIDDVGILKTKVELELIQNSDSFGMEDAKDGIIALAWSIINDDEEDIYKRLVFSWGDTKNQVNDKLYERDLILKKPDKIEL
jgi:hypothetical protein